jgi:hypothetical protein
MHHRTVKFGGTVESERVFVWDQGRLIEEYERSSGSNILVGRYFYSMGDWPVAADLDDGTGQLGAAIFLHDNVLLCGRRGGRQREHRRARRL